MFKKYRFKTLLINILTVVITTVLIGILIYNSTSHTLRRNLEESLMEIAAQGAKIVEKDIEGHFNIIETISVMDVIKDTGTPWEEKVKILNSEFARNAFKRMSIADTEGNSRTNDGYSYNVSDREYFQKAIRGEKNISDPVVSKADGELANTFAVPIYEGDKIVGVLYATLDAASLSRITENIRLGQEGNSFITNDKGEIITYEDKELLYIVHAEPETIEKHPELQSILNMQAQIVKNRSGVGEYIYRDVNRIAAFAPIDGTDWYLTVSAPKNQVFRNVNHMIVLIMSAALFILVMFGIMGIQMKNLKKSLIRQRAKTRTAINTANLLIMNISPEGKILDLNLHAQFKTGYRSSELAGTKTIFDIVPLENHEKVRELLKNANKGKKIKGLEIPITGEDGNAVHALWNVSVVRDQLSDNRHIEILGVDVTPRIEHEKKILAAHEELTALYEELSASEEELKQQFDELAFNQEQLRKSEERYSFVIEASDMGIWDYDLITGNCFYSSKCFEILGKDPSEIDAKSDLLFKDVHPEDIRGLKKSIEYHVKNRTEFFEYEYRIIQEDGSIKWIKTTGKAMWDAYGRQIRLAGSNTDITYKKEYENKVQKLAYYDLLTGMPNRTHFEERATLKLSRKDFKTALFFIDIDNFKYVNDSFGHSYGDSLIVEVGKRILEITEPEDIVARLGGDEFTVLLSEIFDASAVREFADKLLKILNIRFCTRGITINISASIGIALYPQDGNCFEELLKNADTAMYKAKETGKRSYAFFDKSMNMVIYDRMIMESNLRRAIDNNEFILYYQPQYDIKTGKLYGFESLIRWTDPEVGYISPSKFISLAEETEIIIPLGRWILKTACCFIKQFRDNGLENMYISVNVSVTQLMQQEFVEDVLEILEETGLDARRLELEITETILMESIESNLKKIERLREYGIRVALDDFGTGYSSLTYLKQLPISTLKIERAFVHNIAKNEQDEAIAGTIIQLAHSLGLKVVAEGVETKEQLECLMRYECDMIQGYLASKPLPEEEILANIQKLEYFSLEGQLH